MEKTIYNKLIRDRIPEIIKSAGKHYEAVVMSDEEYVIALRSKLVEEAQEVEKAAEKDLITELADLQEVIAALMSACSIDPEQVNAVQDARRYQRGGFEKRLKLIWSG
jgi:predicted house-cleaning noncanonical NTP pyrophosphatase (MazG superfamily)